MATRMMTPLYGDTPEADVEPGSRVDAEDRPHVTLPPLRSMRPSRPRPHRGPRRRLVRGLSTAASVLLGLTIAVVESSARDGG